MDRDAKDYFTPGEMAEHIIVWHMVNDGAVDGEPLAQSFERQYRVLGPGRAAEHFVILALMARAARPGRPEPAVN
jgi:hypothetical protein